MLKGLFVITYYFSYLIFYGFYIGLTVGFAYFSFAGVETWDCYAVQDKDNDTAYASEALCEASADNCHNITQDFKIVDIWGFVTYLLCSLNIIAIHCKGR